MRKIISRASEGLHERNGIQGWMWLRWYPTSLLVYSAGIAALAAENYSNLAAIFFTIADEGRLYETPRPASFESIEAMSEISNAFKRIPGHENSYFPKSEYLHKFLQPQLDDLLYLGASYEQLFDRFEIVQALVYADWLNEHKNRVWGPPGRFVWKHRRREFSASPYNIFLSEARILQNDWPLLKAGFFGQDFTRFEHVAKSYEEYVNKSRLM